ncbi:Alpha-acetolactate decarboxylase [Flavobacterium collinsii]|uniref:Alpha-acetolactate decarboxylase n=2 Tax=Flavobacterium collinsii TaxID=1114861 RepID=A0ABM8KM44_9FLAO|nr:Alpha-acetolactate decarboxylase [Flavobacterium collinsii]
MDAMRNSVYKGDFTIKRLKENENFGLGTFNDLDGELILLDGKVYRVAADGIVPEASSDRRIPFCSSAFFRKGKTIEVEGEKAVNNLQFSILQFLPSSNRFYAIKIKASFYDLTLGGVEKVLCQNPADIAVLMKERPIYKKHNIKGTIIGFYSPPYLGGTGLSPFHFHFFSDDKKNGSHLLDGNFSSVKISIELDEKKACEIVLPNSSNLGYQRKWKSSESKSQY